MVLGLGLLLLASLGFSTVLAAVGTSLGTIPVLPDFLWPLWNFFLLLAAATFLFVIIYKLLPDVPITWSDAWMGASVTSLLFSLSNSVISYYLGHTLVTSVYGRSGSLVVFLLWVYWSAQIFFFGAEFTHVYTKRFRAHRILLPSQTHADAPESSDEEKLPAEGHSLQ